MYLNVFDSLNIICSDTYYIITFSQIYINALFLCNIIESHCMINIIRLDAKFVYPINGI